MSKLLKSNLPSARDTGPAKLPAIVIPKAGDHEGLIRTVKQIIERLDVREGTRGNQWERAVTMRDIADIAIAVDQIRPAAEAFEAIANGGGATSGEASKMIDKFIESIKNLRIFKDLQMRLDDPRRFDNIAAEIREILLSDLAEEAAKRGAAITRIEKIQQDAHRSLAYEVKTITAAVQQAQAAIRTVEWAVGETNFAQAGRITQIVASLGNYYQDGTPGRVMIEQQMTATVDRVTGLNAQYMLKAQANGVLAGYGLAVEGKTPSTTTSAFLVQADKFAVVLPSYNPPTRTVTAIDPATKKPLIDPKTGEVVTYNQVIASEIPTAQGGVPFGIDKDGIYLNNNVYVRGQMRVDAGGKRLIDGLRGSVMAGNQYGSWSDTTARNLIWTRLGNFGSAPNNNHLVIGDMVTLGATTRYWTGSGWGSPGVVINGDMLVNGSVAAHKVDTRGLEVKDPWGNVILSSGIPLKLDYITGLGGLATKDSATIGTTVKFADGKALGTTDFVHSLSKITPNTITNFMDHLAIGNAYIGNAAVSTLKIEGNAVTVPRVFIGSSSDVNPDSEKTLVSGPMAVVAGSSGVLLIGNVSLSDYGSGGQTYRWHLRFYRGSTLLWTSGLAYGTHDLNYGTLSAAFIDENPPAGNHTYHFKMYCINYSASFKTMVRDPTLVVTGAYR